MSAMVSHGACGKMWKQRGNRTGHCAKCHETFEGIALFDWHQTLAADGTTKCRDSSDAKWLAKDLRLVEGAWRGPALPEGTFAKRATDE